MSKPIEGDISGTEETGAAGDPGSEGIAGDAGSRTIVKPGTYPTGWRPIVVACAVLALTACAGTTGTLPTTDVAHVSASIEASLPTLFKSGCAGVSIADGAFKAAAPALVASGKLNGESVQQEASIFAVAQVTCANPPTDLAGAATTLLGQAAAIYLLMAPPAPKA